MAVIDCDNDQEVKHDSTEERNREARSINMSRLSKISGGQLLTRPSTIVIDVEEEDLSETWRQIGKALDRLSGRLSFRF